MTEVLLSMIPLLVVIYVTGAFLGWWTVFGVPVSFRP